MNKCNYVREVGSHRVSRGNVGGPVAASWFPSSFPWSLDLSGKVSELGPLQLRLPLKQLELGS